MIYISLAQATKLGGLGVGGGGCQGEGRGLG